MQEGDPLTLGPEALSLLYVPRAQAEQLMELQSCLASSGSQPTGRHRSAPSDPNEQLLSGALVLVLRHAGGSKLRQVVTATPARGQNETEVLRLQGGQEVRLQQLDARTLEEVPDREVQDLLCEHAYWAYSVAVGPLQRQRVADTLLRMWHACSIANHPTDSTLKPGARAYLLRTRLASGADIPYHLQDRIALLPPYDPHTVMRACVYAAAAAGQQLPVQSLHGLGGAQQQQQYQAAHQGTNPSTSLPPPSSVQPSPTLVNGAGAGSTHAAMPAPTLPTTTPATVTLPTVFAHASSKENVNPHHKQQQQQQQQQQQLCQSRQAAASNGVLTSKAPTQGSPEAQANASKQQGQQQDTGAEGEKGEGEQHKATTELHPAPTQPIDYSPTRDAMLDTGHKPAGVAAHVTSESAAVHVTGEAAAHTPAAPTTTDTPHTPLGKEQQTEGAPNTGAEQLQQQAGEGGVQLQLPSHVIGLLGQALQGTVQHEGQTAAQQQQQQQGVGESEEGRQQQLKMVDGVSAVKREQEGDRDERGAVKREREDEGLEEGEDEAASLRRQLKLEKRARIAAEVEQSSYFADTYNTQTPPPPPDLIPPNMSPNDPSICKYFNLPGGCLRSNCKYLHVKREAVKAERAAAAAAAEFESGEIAREERAAREASRKPPLSHSIRDPDPFHRPHSPLFDRQPPPAASVGQPVCAFFNTPSGCHKGNHCGFKHIEGISGPLPRHMSERTLEQVAGVVHPGIKAYEHDISRRSSPPPLSKRRSPSPLRSSKRHTLRPRSASPLCDANLKRKGHSPPPRRAPQRSPSRDRKHESGRGREREREKERERDVKGRSERERERERSRDRKKVKEREAKEMDVKGRSERERERSRDRGKVKEREAKERDVKGRSERERERERSRDREKAKEREAKEKERERAARERQREREAWEREKEREMALRQREKQRERSREREREREAREREREREARERERERLMARPMSRSVTPAPQLSAAQVKFFKTRMCRDFAVGACKAGDLCVYAHSQSELRTLEENMRPYMPQKPERPPMPARPEKSGLNAVDSCLTLYNLAHVVFPGKSCMDVLRRACVEWLVDSTDSKFSMPGAQLGELCLTFQIREFEEAKSLPLPGKSPLAKVLGDVPCFARYMREGTTVTMYKLDVRALRAMANAVLKRRWEKDAGRPKGLPFSERCKAEKERGHTVRPSKRSRVSSKASEPPSKRSQKEEQPSVPVWSTPPIEYGSSSSTRGLPPTSEAIALVHEVSRKARTSSADGANEFMAGEFEATEEEGELMKTEEGEDGWRQGEEKLGGWEMEEGWWLKSYGLDGDVEEYAGEGEEGEHMQQGWESGAQPSEEALLRRECELEQQQHVLPFEPDELVGSALPAPGVQQSMELTYSQELHLLQQENEEKEQAMRLEQEGQTYSQQQWEGGEGQEGTGCEMQPTYSQEVHLLEQEMEERERAMRSEQQEGEEREEGNQSEQQGEQEERGEEAYSQPWQAEREQEARSDERSRGRSAQRGESVQPPSSGSGGKRPMGIIEKLKAAQRERQERTAAERSREAGPGGYDEPDYAPRDDWDRERGRGGWEADRDRYEEPYHPPPMSSWHSYNSPPRGLYSEFPHDPYFRPPPHSFRPAYTPPPRRLSSPPRRPFSPPHFPGIRPASPPPYQLPYAAR